jgi:hypothetical protein
VKTNVDLRTVDLSAYPDLVVIYLGMRVRTFPGIKTSAKSAISNTRLASS